MVNPGLVFLARTRADREVVTWLTPPPGSAWMLASEVPQNDDWFAYASQLIAGCDVFAYLLSASSIESGGCARELQYAVSVAKRPILRLDLDDISYSATPELLRDVTRVSLIGLSPTLARQALLTALDDLADRRPKHQ